MDYFVYCYILYLFIESVVSEGRVLDVKKNKLFIGSIYIFYNLIVLRKNLKI